jgi:hypothetical protein
MNRCVSACEVKLEQLKTLGVSIGAVQRATVCMNRVTGISKGGESMCCVAPHQSHRATNVTRRTSRVIRLDSLLASHAHTPLTGYGFIVFEDPEYVPRALQTICTTQIAPDHYLSAQMSNASLR